MTAPAGRDLQRVVAALASRLEAQVEGMLDDPRFEAGRNALERLRDASYVRDLDAVDPLEAAWLADELGRRWAAVGEVVLDPIAWIEGDVDDGGRVRLTVRTEGLEPGWSVAWNGAVPEDDPGVATGSAHQPVTVRVMGRGHEGRTILTATWEPQQAPHAPEAPPASGASPAPANPPG